MNIEFDVSVIVPFYNASAYIARCARSLFEQTMADNIQFIFVDDCSTDNSVNVLQKALEEYPERKASTKIIKHQSNKGVASARNTGLDAADGQYIGWVDADDWVEANMFYELYTYAHTTNSDIVWSDFFIETNEGARRVSEDCTEDTKALINALLENRHGMLWNKLFNRTLLVDNKVRLLDGQNMGEDKNLCIKAFACARKVTYKREGTFYHYMQDRVNSYSKDRSGQRGYEEITNAMDAIEFLEKIKGLRIADTYKNCFTYNAKKRLLLSSSIEDLKSWSVYFKESNHLVKKDKTISFYHRFLGYFSENKIVFPLWLWCKLKKMKNNVFC